MGAKYPKHLHTKGEQKQMAYQIPRNVKGEGRILFIFSKKALITTGIGAGIRTTHKVAAKCTRTRNITEQSY